MKTDGTWGDHVILHGAANCFETCIHVISSLPHHHDVWICPEYDVTGSNRLVLGHLNKLHYVSLIPDIGWKDVWLHCNVKFPNSRYQNSNHKNEAVAPFISALFAKVTIKLATKALSLFCGIAACKKLLQKVESSFTVCNRIRTCCEFTGQGKLVLQQVSKGECCTGRFATTILMVEQCCNHSKQCRNNVVATSRWAKNRRCESSRVTPPLNPVYGVTWCDFGLISAKQKSVFTHVLL